MYWVIFHSEQQILMKINLIINLYAPYNYFYIDGIRLALFSKTINGVEFTPKNIEQLVCGKSLVFSGMDFFFMVKSFDPVTENMVVDGAMRETRLEYLKSLIEDGWNPDRKAAGYYRVVIPE
jgi:hypothetical protein